MMIVICNDDWNKGNICLQSAALINFLNLVTHFGEFLPQLYIKEAKSSNLSSCSSVCVVLFVILLVMSVLMLKFIPSLTNFFFFLHFRHREHPICICSSERYNLTVESERVQLSVMETQNTTLCICWPSCILWKCPSSLMTLTMK